MGLERLWAFQSEENVHGHGQQCKMTYTCTCPLIHTSICLDLHKCAPLYLATHRCLQMSHKCPEHRCSQVPIDKHRCPHSHRTFGYPNIHMLLFWDMNDQAPPSPQFPGLLAKWDLKLNRSGFGTPRSFLDEQGREIQSQGHLGDLAMPSRNTVSWAQPYSSDCLGWDSFLLMPPSHQS